MDVPYVRISQLASHFPHKDHYKVDTACDPGNTLLWDLIQDGNIEQLAEGLAMEAEKALGSLLCISMERFIRLKFIEGCLRNIAQNK